MTGIRAVLAAVWVVGVAGGILYSQQQQIAPAIAIPLLAALLVEITGWVGMNRIAWWSDRVLLASAIIPYFLYAVPTGTFAWPAAVEVSLLAAAAVFWFRVAPRHPAVDLIFLAAVAAVYLAKRFQGIYVELHPRAEAEILGKLMWIRLALTGYLRHRVDGATVGFGFIPTGREWLVGLRYFALLLPAALGLAVALDFARFRVDQAHMLRAPLVFIGVLWGVALWEEFFFRGVVLEAVRSRLGAAAGIAISSLAFGAVHLWFGAFPNWRFALLAAVAAVFYALAYRAAGGIRAAMVTHSLMVTVWKTLAA